jgi:hypothetical protein
MQWIWPKPRTRAPEGIWLHMIRQTLTLNRILDGIGVGDRGVLFTRWRSIVATMSECSTIQQRRFCRVP